MNKTRQEVATTDLIGLTVIVPLWRRTPLPQCILSCWCSNIELHKIYSISLPFGQILMAIVPENSSAGADKDEFVLRFVVASRMSSEGSGYRAEWWRRWNVRFNFSTLTWMFGTKSFNFINNQTLFILGVSNIWNTIQTQLFVDWRGSCTSIIGLITTIVSHHVIVDGMNVPFKL